MAGENFFEFLQKLSSSMVRSEEVPVLLQIDELLVYTEQGRLSPQLILPAEQMLALFGQLNAVH